MNPKKPLRTLSQRYGLWRTQELGLFDDEIRLVYYAGPNRSARTFPVDWVDLNESEARLSPLWARRLFIFALLALGASVAAGLQWGTAGWAAAGGFALLAGIAAAAYFLAAYDAVYFYNSFTGEFLFALRADRPDAETVSSFIREVKGLVEKGRERAKMESEMPSIAAEIHHLARLKEKEFISDEEYVFKKEELIEDLLRD